MMEAGFKSTEVHDRMGAAIDVQGDVYVKPVEEGELERDYVVYVVGRGGRALQMAAGPRFPEGPRCWPCG